MGVFIVVGGANGIGKATVEVLRQQGHRVINADREGGDIVADIKYDAGRRLVIDRVHEMFPDGIDGLACIAGIVMREPDRASVLSVNYFGTIAVAEGLFDLLQKKSGSCVVTASGSLTWDKAAGAPDLADILVNCGDEARIGRFVNSLPANDNHNDYGATKLALLKWVRRHSADWAMRGVRLNAIGPGCVNTRMGNLPPSKDRNDSFQKTIPTHYHDLTILEPRELGEVFAFLLSSRASGVSGTIVWTDGGQESYYHVERTP